PPGSRRTRSWGRCPARPRSRPPRPRPRRRRRGCRPGCNPRSRSAWCSASSRPRRRPRRWGSQHRRRSRRHRRLPARRPRLHPSPAPRSPTRRSHRHPAPHRARLPLRCPARVTEIAAGLHSWVMTHTPEDLTAAVRAALAKVIDPELRKPITELGMVKSVTVGSDSAVHVDVYLTTSACPKKTEIADAVRAAVTDVPGTGAVTVGLDVMDDEQRAELRKKLRGDSREPVIPFAQPGSLTRVYAVASGKGGVGKSSVTVNLAAAMAARGLSVGVLDADIYGHSVPRMMGTEDRPVQVDSMIVPPVAHNVKVISIAMFTAGNTPVVWRGPMLHRALQQFLADVYWGDLDVLLLDLPPGTGDVAISVAQLIPSAEILVVTTPQAAAAEVAERAGAIALQTRQRIVGVV